MCRNVMEMIEKPTPDAREMAGLPSRAAPDHPVDADLDRARNEERDEGVGPGHERERPAGRGHEEAGPVLRVR